MALDGGGGGGGLVGSSNTFTGTSTALEFVGTHVYGYSGSFESSTTNQVAIDYDNGSKYLRLTIQFCGATNYATPAAGSIGVCKISVGGLAVAQLKAHTSSSSDAIFSAPSSEIIVPAYSNLKVEVVSSEDTADELVFIAITGRVYE